ncbi:MAG: SDR family NAD(P)-dependent oxidoreductase [Sphaerochaetaceae bacterium]
MSDFYHRLRQNAPAVVRGLTFNGETGLFVTTLEDGSSCDLVLSAPDPEKEAKEIVLAWRNEYSAYAEHAGVVPARVGIQGEAWSMGLGATLEEAWAGRGTQVKPSDRGSSRRADVMQGKISLVTGGAQGFGEGIVRGLIAEGGFVFIADMNIAGAVALAGRLNAQAGHVVAEGVAVNVTDELSVEAMMDRVASRTGSLDLLVSNAGVLKAGSVKDLSLKDFQFVTSVDYTGFFICTKFASRQMALQNMGSGGVYATDIVAISSKSGLEGSNKNGAYAGAKFGTIGLTQSFALELVVDNIKVNAVCPGNFLDGPLWSDPDKGLFVQYLAAGKVPGARTVADVRRFYESKVPMNRGCRTEDVVRAICYIVEQKYETGQAVPVTGGQVMLN